MPTNERSLWVRLGLSSKQYNKGLNRAEKRQDKFKKQTTKLGGAIKGAIAGIGVAAVGSYINSVIRAQTETQRWADRLGIGVEALQELQFVGKQYGITQDAITDGLKELSLRTDEFVKTGIGPAAEAFERLGLKQEELNKVSGDTEALFELIQSRIQNVGNVAARQRIADELFGGQGGEQFVEMLSSSSDELNRMRQEARDMGAVVDKEASQATEELSTNISNLGSAISGTASSIVSDMAPALNALVKGMTNAMTSGKEFAKVMTGKGSGGMFGAKGMDAQQNLLNMLGLGEEQFDEDILSGIKGPGEGGPSGGGGKSGGDKKPIMASDQAATNLNKIGSGFAAILPQVRASREELQKLGTTFQNQVTPQMDNSVRKVKEFSLTFQERLQNEVGQGINLLTSSFAGLQGVIQQSLASSEGFLESFGKFFASFLQNMIVKLAAAAATAFLLGAALAAITGGALGTGIGTAGKLLGGTAGNITGALGLAEGGQIKKPGNYIVGEEGPERLNLPSGSTVRPLSNVPSGAGEGKLVASVSGESLNFVMEKYNRKKGNTF